MSPFEDALQMVLDVEGGYVNHRNDPGGKTNFGITEDTAREAGYDGPMDQLPMSKAVEIYRSHYWRKMGLDDVVRVAGEPLAIELFEAGVNTGVRRPIRWLQTWLNRYNVNGQLYADIAVDGIYGPETAEALATFCHKRRHLSGLSVLRRSLNCSQAAYYASLADAEPGRFESFIYGWMRERVAVPAR